MVIPKEQSLVQGGFLATKESYMGAQQNVLDVDIIPKLIVERFKQATLGSHQEDHTHTEHVCVLICMCICSYKHHCLHM